MVAPSARWKGRLAALGLLCGMTLFAFCLQGYHPGAEDDGIYLSAIKKDLHPALYPYNSAFFTVQTRATLFDEMVAATVRLSHLPLSYVLLGWQLGAIALVLAGCWRLLAFCFDGIAARLAGVLAVACVLSLPVAGTGLSLTDEHLHPRTLATAAILFAVNAMQRRQRGRAWLLLAAAALIHPLMAAFGVSFCVLYALVARFAVSSQHALPEHALPGRNAPRRAAVLPGAWAFTRPTAAWRQALAQHTYYTISAWHWDEWLGALAPPLLLVLLARLGGRRGNQAFLTLAATAAVYSVVQLVIALALLLPPGADRFTPLQPMRYLQLTYLVMALLAGAALGEHALRGHLARWLLVFLPLAAVNGWGQRLRYPATRNLELPWSVPSSDWLRAFAWVRANTPQDAVFALDPRYLALPGDDNHSFRALAERSSLADGLKDAAAVTQVPQLAQSWLAQQEEQKGWPRWTRADFVRLERTSPVRWVIVVSSQPVSWQANGLSCPYRNSTVSVCQLPLL